MSALSQTLREKEGLETLVLSIDDLYLTREEQVRLATENADNKLVQCRGEPGSYRALFWFGVRMSILMIV